MAQPLTNAILTFAGDVTPAARAALDNILSQQTTAVYRNIVRLANNLNDVHIMYDKGTLSVSGSLTHRAAGEEAMPLFVAYSMYVGSVR